jgi:hypothetical protein
MSRGFALLFFTMTRIAAGLLLAIMLLAVASPADAIPAFARKYKTSCQTCHYAFPVLNAFGKAFRNNGYRYPAGQDRDMTKDEPVNLGSEGYKKVWPDAIWPSDMAGTPPVSLRALGRFHYMEAAKLSTFEIPHELELLFAGTFDDRISYFGEIELEHEAELAYGFKVQYDFSPLFHFALGDVGLDRVTPEHLRLTREHYNITQLANQSDTWTLEGGAGGGMQLSGAANGSGGVGGLTYSLGVGNGQNDADNFDLNNHKDVYGSLGYKIGGLGEAGGTAGQEEKEQSAYYVDNSVRLGGFGYSGTAVDDDAKADKFSLLGGEVEGWYDRFIVMATVATMKSDYNGAERDSRMFFVEGRYVALPWLIATPRYESTDRDVDDEVDARTALIPAVTAMVRANVRCSAEYKIPLDDASKKAKAGRFTFQFDYAL